MLPNFTLYCPLFFEKHLDLIYTANIQSEGPFINSCCGLRAKRDKEIAIREIINDSAHFYSFIYPNTRYC